MTVNQENEGYGDDHLPFRPTALKAAFAFEFPLLDTLLAQDSEHVDITFPPTDGSPAFTERVRFHDYSAIYSHQGLYESLFHIRLRCHSPQELVALLTSCIELREAGQQADRFKILDIGAGNGLVGEELRLQLQGRIESLVGTDILPEARTAVLRDRPKVYDRYVVTDLIANHETLMPEQGDYDILVICAAFGPGWGDMPIEALWKVLQLLKNGGLLAVTVNEQWLDSRPTMNEGKESLWNSFIARLTGDDGGYWTNLTVQERKKYRHRLNMRGEWIWYVAFVLQKG